MIKERVVENIALFDMDGTLCDYDKAIIKDYNSIKSPSDPEYVSFSKEIEENPILKARIKLIRNVPGWWQNMEKYKPGFDILNLAKELGFTINILTKGPRSSPASWSEKVTWVKEHLKDYDPNITISEDKGIVYGKVLVDDNPEYIERWLQNRPRGLVIMPAYDYNKDFVENNVIRYDGTNLEQVKEAMLKAMTRKPDEDVKYK
jgi:5'(3')-deoxyribonucleotidase